MRLAQGNINLGVPEGSGFTNLETLQIAGIISLGIQLILVVTAIILFFVLIGGGLAVIVSGGGDAQGSAKGKQAVTGAVIGLLVVFGAWAIMQLIDVFFGINILGGLSILP